MGKRNICPRFTAESGFYLYLAILLLLVPFRWVLAMGISVGIHELGHIVAISFMKIPVLQVSLKALRIQIHTQSMTPSQELICAAAGPLAGSMLILLAKWLPATSVCAAIHCMYNLLPLYPSDGGRVLRSVLRLWVQESTAAFIERTVRSIVLLTLLGIGIAGAVTYGKWK